MQSSVDRLTPSDDLHRRRFLKQTAFGLAALSIGGCLPDVASDALPPEIADRLRFASPGELLVLQAVAEQMVDLPPNGGPMTSADLALRMDQYLAGADQEVQDQFHQLLSVFNNGIAAFLFDLRWTSFLGMSPADRATYLRDWMESPIAFRRTAFIALKRVAMSSYYSSSASWPAIGYDADHTPRGSA